MARSRSYRHREVHVQRRAVEVAEAAEERGLGDEAAEEIGGVRSTTSDPSDEIGDSRAIGTPDIDLSVTARRTDRDARLIGEWILGAANDRDERVGGGYDDWSAMVRHSIQKAAAVARGRSSEDRRRESILPIPRRSDVSGASDLGCIAREEVHQAEELMRAVIAKLVEGHQSVSDRYRDDGWGPFMPILTTAPDR